MIQSLFCVVLDHYSPSTAEGIRNEDMGRVHIISTYVGDIVQWFLDRCMRDREK